MKIYTRNKDSKTVHMYCDKTTHSRFKKLCIDQNISMSDKLLLLVQAELKEKDVYG